MKIIILVIVLILVFGCVTYTDYESESSEIKTIESNAELKLITVLTLFFGSFIYSELNNP